MNKADRRTLMLRIIADSSALAASTAMAQAGEHRSHLLAERDDEREATWRERALNAEEALKAARAGRPRVRAAR